MSISRPKKLRESEGGKAFESWGCRDSLAEHCCILGGGGDWSPSYYERSLLGVFVDSFLHVPTRPPGCGSPSRHGLCPLGASPSIYSSTREDGKRKPPEASCPRSRGRWCFSWDGARPPAPGSPELRAFTMIVQSVNGQSSDSGKSEDRRKNLIPVSEKDDS